MIGSARKLTNPAIISEGWVKKGKAWAQSNLANAYALGAYGLPQSYVMAVKLFGMGVEQGYPSAMCLVGFNVHPSKGQGVDQSYEKSAELFHKWLPIVDMPLLNLI